MKMKTIRSYHSARFSIESDTDLAYRMLQHFSRDKLRLIARHCGVKIGRTKADLIFNLRFGKTSKQSSVRANKLLHFAITASYETSK